MGMLGQSFVILAPLTKRDERAVSLFHIKCASLGGGIGPFVQAPVIFRRMVRLVRNQEEEEAERQPMLL